MEWVLLELNKEDNSNVQLCVPAYSELESKSPTLPPFILTTIDRLLEIASQEGSVTVIARLSEEEYKAWKIVVQKEETIKSLSSMLPQIQQMAAILTLDSSLFLVPSKTQRLLVAKLETIRQYAGDAIEIIDNLVKDEVGDVNETV